MSVPADEVGANPDWSTARERSNTLVLRVMSWIAVACGRRATRLLLHPITLYFLAFAPAQKRHATRYLRRALGREPVLADFYRHVHAFASTVLDRVYLLRGRMDLFDIRSDGHESLRETLTEGQGAFVMGAHIGSFEALHAIGRSNPALDLAMVMYPDNARMINAALAAIAPDTVLKVIPLGRRGTTLAIRDWLDGGGVAGILGDRTLPTENARKERLSLPFLGAPAPFSDGPFRLAMLLRRRVFFMVGLYRGGNRYDVRFEPLADFRERASEPADRETAVRAALLAYVARLEALCREAPSNWFNFHDFWEEDAA